MTFRDILAEVIEWLEQDERISYRAMRRQFDLDDDYLEDLKLELIEVKQVAVDQDSKMLVWTGAPPDREQGTQPETDRETRFQTLLPAIILLLQRERHVTYRTLKYAFDIDDAFLTEIQEELRLRCLALDEEGKVLVWTGESRSASHTQAVAPSQPAIQPAIAEITIAPPVTLPAPLSPVTETNEPIVDPEASSTDVLSDEAIITSEPVRSAPEAERRQLTVMFCDLVDSTDLSGKLDPEHLREVVKAYQETAADVIGHYEGHIAQYLGDGLLIYFGFPVAHEDDAQRAVYTGLELPGAMANLNARLKIDYGVELLVRIGIHTGPVVVGEMGGGGRHENLALGETPNIAARLEGLAQPNTAVISSVTAQLVRRAFVMEELGLHELKGVSEPMMLYTVVSPRGAEPDEHETMLARVYDLARENSNYCFKFNQLQEN